MKHSLCRILTVLPSVLRAIGTGKLRGGLASQDHVALVKSKYNDSAYGNLGQFRFEFEVQDTGVFNCYFNPDFSAAGNRPVSCARDERRDRKSHTPRQRPRQPGTR